MNAMQTTIRWAFHNQAWILVCLLAATSPSQAAQQCVTPDGTCDLNKLCTFRAMREGNQFVYQIYLANSPATNRAPKHRLDGVTYRGDLYDEALTQARASKPNASEQEIRELAGANLQTLVSNFAMKMVEEGKFKPTTCADDAAIVANLLPKNGSVNYTGMETDQDCRVWAKYLGGRYDAPTFGSNDATTCVEFYNMDRAHEEHHRRGCVESKQRQEQGQQTKHWDTDGVIADELKAYRLSMDLAAAHIKLLAYQCSTRRNQRGLTARAKALQDLMDKYAVKKKEE
jgi:hypothetical protein